MFLLSTDYVNNQNIFITHCDTLIVTRNHSGKVGGWDQCVPGSPPPPIESLETEAIAKIDIMAHRKSKDCSLVWFICMCTESLCRKKDYRSSCFFTTKETGTLNFKVLHACMLECVFHQVTLMLTTVVQLAIQLCF